jgi:hypothetical protein
MSIVKYQPLPIEITQNGGHHYRQLWRDDYAAVYEQRNAFGAFLGYEAIAIKRQEACRAFGRQYPAKELYPCSEDWGRLAVSVSDLDRAMDAAREFSRRAAKRQNTHLKGSDSSRIRQGRRGSQQGATLRPPVTSQRANFAPSKGMIGRTSKSNYRVVMRQLSTVTQ